MMLVTHPSNDLSTSCLEYVVSRVRYLKEILPGEGDSTPYYANRLVVIAIVPKFNDRSSLGPVILSFLQIVLRYRGLRVALLTVFFSKSDKISSK